MSQADPIATIAALLRHSQTPAAGGPLRVLARFFAWQVLTRLGEEPRTFRFVSGTRLVVRRGQTSATAQFYYGLHEWDIGGFLLHAIRRGDRVVDIGANVGVFTVLAAGVGDATVIACEPGPEECAALAANISLNQLDGRVSVRRLAVGAAPGTLTMRLGHGAMNRVDAAADAVVEVTTLDDLWTEGGIDILKIDTVGYELAVLNGGRRALTDPRLKALILGNARRARDCGFAPEDVIDAVRAAGFVAVTYDPERRALTAVDVVDHDRRAIFVRAPAEMAARLAAAEPFEVRGRRF